MLPNAAPEPLLLVILGPTASGKSSLALSLAQMLSGEIVSCDSVAVYRDFEIGTAKSPRAERQLIPHHLIDVVEPGEAFTAGEYARHGRAKLGDITARGKLPIVVGGTGLYLRALLQGLFPGPQRLEDLRERLRERATRRGSSYLHRVLCRLDSSSAAQIHPNDTPKLIRAVEVCLSAGRPMSELWQAKGREPLRGYRLVRIGLNPERAQLYGRINARAESMFEDGLVEETRALVAKYPHLTNQAPFNSLGYKQALQHVRGELTWGEAISLTQQGHRNFAKRQMTWFRREPEVNWLYGFGDDPAVKSRVADIVRAYIGEAKQPQ